MINVVKPIRILVADDDPDDQIILKDSLLNENSDLAIHCVFNGGEALSALMNSADDDLPSLIVLDYKMPVLNGLKALEKMKEDSRYATIPKVVWSTSGREEHKRACMENGAVHYFTKPTTTEDLARMAARMLEILFKGRANDR